MSLPFSTPAVSTDKMHDSSGVMQVVDQAFDVLQGLPETIAHVLSLPFSASEVKTDKIYVSSGLMIAVNEALKLPSLPLTTDDLDIVSTFSIGYNLDSSFSVEFGLISPTEVSVSMPDGATGTLFGKFYFVDTSLGRKLGIKAKTDMSKLIGIKWSETLLNTNADIYLKTGFMFWDVDYSIYGDGTLTYGATFAPSTFATANGNDPYFGIGVSYPVEKDISIVVDYMQSKINTALTKGMSASVVYNF